MKPAPLPALRLARPLAARPAVPPRVPSPRADAFDRASGFTALRQRRPGAGRGK